MRVIWRREEEEAVSCIFWNLVGSSREPERREIIRPTAQEEQGRACKRNARSEVPISTASAFPFIRTSAESCGHSAAEADPIFDPTQCTPARQPAQLLPYFTRFLVLQAKLGRKIESAISPTPTPNNYQYPSLRTLTVSCRKSPSYEKEPFRVFEFFSSHEPKLSCGTESRNVACPTVREMEEGDGEHGELN